jgi:NADH dehydrogenase (ubiquinone) 1 beta subcomplex subunit 6
MAFSGDKSIAEIDKEAIEKFNRALELSLEREKRLLRHYEWRGNKLPPFNIQPLAHERQRLSGTGMTAEDRALRRQWLKDQELSPNEPRYIPELYPKNPIRRALAAPWDFFCGMLKPFLGENHTANARFYLPKLAISSLLLYVTYYHLKYNGSSWTDKHGWHIYSNKPRLLPGDVLAPTKEADDYYDRGFKSRKALLDLQTSTAPN